MITTYPNGQDGVIFPLQDYPLSRKKKFPRKPFNKFVTQGSYPFPGFFQDLKIHINPFNPKISMLILLSVCHTLHSFLLALKKLPELSRTSSFFSRTFQSWECHKKFQDFPGFPGLVRTLFIIWLAPRAGKMNQILRCDWLPERARWSHLARSRLPALSRKKNFPKSHIIINPLLTKLVRSRWLDIGRVLFLCVYGPRLRLGPQTQKKNSANIQPS